MKSKVLITGGAGFIGSHLADELLVRGYSIRVLDNLCEQVHGADALRPKYLNDDVELVIGDVRDWETVAQSLKGVDAVFHFASMVGVGQSMYEIAKYTGVNNMGTATLLECLTQNPLQKLIVASSMSLYGEGLYKKQDGTITEAQDRSLDRLRNGEWEVFDAQGNVLEPLPTPETKTPSLASIYALSKFDQERMCLMIGRAYNIPTVAMRFFNVFGTRQALSNPYTGVLAIFASRLANGNSPLIFEDGNQRRDFVSVYDVAEACVLALESDQANDQVFNVGSGNSYTIRELAERFAKVLGKEVTPEITKQYRVGDIRHCFADITKAQTVLGYKPEVTIESGMAELAEWLRGEQAVDNVAAAQNELLTRGLAV
ncbi:MAG: NAD-dependent epimerase/dehydratase family protein [Pyrinomonadaceae bacterium]